LLFDWFGWTWFVRSTFVGLRLLGLLLDLVVLFYGWFLRFFGYGLFTTFSVPVYTRLLHTRLRVLFWFWFPFTLDAHVWLRFVARSPFVCGLRLPVWFGLVHVGCGYVAFGSGFGLVGSVTVLRLVTGYVRFTGYRLLVTRTPFAVVAAFFSFTFGLRLLPTFVTLPFTLGFTAFTTCTVYVAFTFTLRSLRVGRLHIYLYGSVPVWLLVTVLLGCFRLFPVGCVWLLGSGYVGSLRLLFGSFAVCLRLRVRLVWLVGYGLYVTTLRLPFAGSRLLFGLVLVLVCRLGYAFGYRWSVYTFVAFTLRSAVTGCHVYRHGLLLVSLVRHVGSLLVVDCC